MPTPPSRTKRKPGRPAITDSRRHEMREQIGAVAKYLFQTEGYGQISIRRIAQKVGCSPMTLYKYFDTKIDILRTLWTDVFKDVSKTINAVDVETTSQEEQLFLLSKAYVGYWLAHSEHYRLVFMAEGVTQPEVSVFLDNTDLLELFETFGDAITAACAQPPNPDQVKVKLDSLICFLNGIAHNLITISGYPWSTSDSLIETAIAGVISDTKP